jgi:hypothetical protein
MIPCPLPIDYGSADECVKNGQCGCVHWCIAVNRACAEAMGLEHGWDDEWVWLRLNTSLDSPMPKGAEPRFLTKQFFEWVLRYDPLKNDEQAMALVKKFGLEIEQIGSDEKCWVVSATGEYLEEQERWETFESESENLNRAICECVAKLSTKTVSS